MTDLYPQVHDWSNLLQAHAQAARGKRGGVPAAAFEERLADHLIELADELRHKTYQPGSYQSFYIHEPKRRLISAAPFRDRVVHHALVNVIEPLFERRFVSDSYANRKGKGTHRAIDRCQSFARRYRYVLSCDVRQHFPSIDHDILRAILADVIWDDDVLGLCDRIRPRGLPIGNLTSQFWANCYLDPFDHFVKRELRCRAYLRYVDDMAFFSNSRRELWRWKEGSSSAWPG
jgi:retron-type reverse transcriptase